MDVPGQIGRPVSLARQTLRRLRFAMTHPAAAVRHVYRTLWVRAARFRWVFATNVSGTSTIQNAARFGMGRFLELPDGHYRRLFRTIGHQMNATGEGRGGPKRDGILLVIGTLGPGGAERQFVQTLKGLKARGVGNVAAACVNLATPTNRFFLPELEAASIPAVQIGCEPGPLDPAVATLINALPPELQDVRDYASTLASRRPTVAHLWLDEVNIKGGIAAVITGVPRIVLSQRSQPPIHFALHQPHMREGYRWLARAPGVVMINNSEAGARAYERWLGLPVGSIGVVRNGFAFDERELSEIRLRRGLYRQRYGISAAAPLVGSVFRFSEEKRPLLWLEIAARIRRELPGAQFLIVGKGQLAKTLEARAARPDLNGAVHFAGHITDTLGAMADMDLVLLTSRVEGLPNILIEAQSLGIPVVSTAAGGVIEAVDHMKSGWLLETADPEVAAKQVVTLLRDKLWLERAARNGPSFAFQRFHINRAIDETLAIYRGQGSLKGVELGGRQRATV